MSHSCDVFGRDDRDRRGAAVAHTTSGQLARQLANPGSYLIVWELRSNNREKEIASPVV